MHLVGSLLDWETFPDSTDEHPNRFRDAFERHFSFWGATRSRDYPVGGGVGGGERKRQCGQLVTPSSATEPGCTKRPPKVMV